MRLLWTYLATFYIAWSCKAIIILDDSDPGQCDQSNHGDQVLVLDRENKEQILTCTKNDGVYQWTTVGGDDPVGELYSPGYDCSKILDSRPEAKDGLYWIHLGGYYPKQVYCDMTTDGGGYYLVGRKNTSVTWTLPSNDFPVEPYGDPHWASNLGDAPILDFRIQVAKKEDFGQTIAHWSFRMQSERPLKKLMIMDKGGCGPTSPGIGNISYVKDLQTEKIVTTTFRCSTFGGYFHPSTHLGWGMMNSCLNKPCKRGFAFFDHPTLEYQLEHSGCFSYSTSANTSGITHSSTAFVGCDKGVCCGCYGPIGGTADYCGTDCTAQNGGKVLKNVYTWFWVRSSLPKKVWHRCMEYKVTMKNGETVSYRLWDGNTTPEKGRCPDNDALLNEGIVVVPDGEVAKKVPAVPGLLQYRKDNKKLYVRSNETWKVIAPEKKILEKTSEMVDPKLESIEEQFQKQNRTVNRILKSDVAQLKTELQSNITQLKTEETKLKSDIAQLKTKDTELKSDITQLKTELKSNITQLKTNDTELKRDITEMQRVIENLNDTLNNLLSVVKDIMFSESVIISGKYSWELKLKSWIGGSFTANLCWRASRDGWSASTFHSNCDNKKPTVTIVKVGQYIFGGYATESWGGGGNKQAPGSFIFSMRNKENLPPFKAPLKNRNDGIAIDVYSSRGPAFGSGHDLAIYESPGSNTNSHAHFGSSYQPPSGVSDPHTILAGTTSFSPSEVEVFYIV